MHISEHSTQQYKKKSKKHKSYFYVEIKVDKNLIVIIIKHYTKVSSWSVSLKLYRTMVLVIIKHYTKVSSWSVSLKLYRTMVLVIIKHYTKFSSWSVSLKLYRTMVLVIIKPHIKILKQSILQAYRRKCHSSQNILCKKRVLSALYVQRKVPYINKFNSEVHHKNI